MKQKHAVLSTKFMDSVFTPLSLVLISIVAIIAVAVALFQVNKGPVAPNAPQSLPQAADFTNNSCSFTFTVPGPTATPGPKVVDLELSKTVNDSSPTVGQNIIFRVAVFNRGPDNATGVHVQDILPAGLTYVSDDSNGAYDKNTGVWNIGAIAVNETKVIRITATVTVAGPLTNYAQVSSSVENDSDSTPGDNSGTGNVPHQDDDGSVTINSNAQTVDLELIKRASNLTPQVGSDVAFTIQVVNKGPADATNVTISDVLPAGVALQSYTAETGTSFDSTTGVWTIGNLAADQTKTLDLIVKVTGTDPITNYAQVQTSSPTDSDSIPGNGPQTTDEDDDDSVTIVPVVVPTNTPVGPTATPTPEADLSLTKQVSNSTPRVGENVTYTVTVYNAGPDTATNVTVREPLVGGTTYVSSNPSQGSYNKDTGIWTIGTIPANQSRTLQIVVTVNVTGATTNTAQVEHSDQHDGDSTPGNNNPNEDDQQSATVNPEEQGADLSLLKRVNLSTPVVGQNVTFTIEVHNAGPRQADSVTVKDLIPSGVTFIDAQPSQGSYNSGNGIWSIGSITKDSTVTMLLTVRVDTTNQVVNIAEVASSSQPDQDSTPNNNNPNEDDQDDSIIRPQTRAALPKAGNASKTTLFVIATGVIVLIIGAMGLLLLL